MRKENRKRLLAALFMLVFLLEVGSHGAICSIHSPTDEQAITFHEGEHDDPCKSLILCGDSQRKDRQMPNLSHDAVQHNALFDGKDGFSAQTLFQRDPLIPFKTAHCLFRSISPPFHPPELS